MSNVIEFKKQPPKNPDYNSARASLAEVKAACAKAKEEVGRLEARVREAETKLEWACSHQDEQVCRICYWGGPRGYCVDYICI